MGTADSRENKARKFASQIMVLIGDFIEKKEEAWNRLYEEALKSGAEITTTASRAKRRRG